MSSSSAARNGVDSRSSDAIGSVNTTSSSARETRRPHQRPPRSLPPWIDSYDERYGSVTTDQLRLLNPPARSVQPQHNSTPAEPERRVSKDGFVERDDPLFGRAQESQDRIPHFLRYGRASKRGRKWDHLRSAEPVIVAGFSPAVAQREPTASWQDFIQSSAWGRIPNEQSEVVDYSVLDNLYPTFNQKAETPANQPYPSASRRRRTLALSKRMWNAALRHSLAPLLFRLTVMLTSIVALGIAAQIYILEDSADNDSAERTQSIVAVTVDCVAIPYIGYMVWDEYTGKPLGLRSVVSKVALILLDLFFIIFKSASTALAFESLAYNNVSAAEVRDLARALATFQLIGLIAWTMTFTVNIFRTVERLGGVDDDHTHV
ncbi:hypothetical protein S7711_08445 [Stachybotrys chartarum IBT 7711]|uniref:Uncharacterized protein n=1 Tax=Stachybotrys chartarum (strain CBS 109288 / IBT 7711) TaxID=1280523 RepID=A0A084AIC6_STACB|nr:hypothetical protein S7711_08445 [Stachybotrys chartarum IBT 7711]